ncbi:PLP-dependent aminotransferase family protein [Trinickia fusca]|uniref:PLP-dependent aminotransferase family protein n=1 Tax=Trinickia fusca TaxID=2419777 RepID=A0A494XL17_9BURK|nr:PLP-dependent aminotransferase family protein [Trinickia fusca]RKP49356.1 PLP-dependent aminotransferase family protein [Trinickia fusca]
MNASAPHRYERLADLITGMIEVGTLAPGERLPSLRNISEQHDISVSTALQAYRLLEDRGVLVARPQSGFYVSHARPGALALPSRSRPPAKAANVSIAGVVATLLEHAADTTLVPLGCAVPDSALLEAHRLDRALAHAARTNGTAYNVYSAPRGELRLRQEIAKRAMRWGHAVSPEDIVVTSGCTEALALALASLTEHGDTVAIESPTYFGLLHTLEVLGLKAFELPTDPTSGVDVAALERLLATETVAACVLSSSFNNPLGSTIPEAGKRQLLRLLETHAVPLIEDDIYGDIYFGRERPKPFIALEGGANTVYCSSFSKSLAPGYRVGWVMTGALMPRIVERKFGFSLTSAVLPQVALAEFLTSGGYDQHLRRIRRLFQDNLARMTSAIEASFPAGTRVSRPDGGFVLWVELPKRLDTRALFDDALEAGICFAPGDVFSASRRFRHCLRLSAGHVWNTSIDEGVRKLGALAQAALSR